MLKKTKALIITFDETVQAMAAERYCNAHHLPGRLIPVPREITAGCGLAWKALPEQEDTLTEALSGAGIRWSAAHVLMV